MLGINIILQGKRYPLNSGPLQKKTWFPSYFSVRQGVKNDEGPHPLWEFGMIRTWTQDLTIMSLAIHFPAIKSYRSDPCVLWLIRVKIYYGSVFFQGVIILQRSFGSAESTAMLWYVMVCTEWCHQLDWLLLVTESHRQWCQMRAAPVTRKKETLSIKVLEYCVWFRTWQAFSLILWQSTGILNNLLTLSARNKIFHLS